MYEQMDPEERRLMNQAIYTKLYIFEVTITDAVFNPPFDELADAKVAISKSSKVRRQEHSPGSLELALSRVGSNKRVMVELIGLEPTTCWLQTSCSAN
jgi:hypothetical protein